MNCRFFLGDPPLWGDPTNRTLKKLFCAQITGDSGWNFYSYLWLITRFQIPMIRRFQWLQYSQIVRFVKKKFDTQTFLREHKILQINQSRDSLMWRKLTSLKKPWLGQVSEYSLWYVHCCTKKFVPKKLASKHSLWSIHYHGKKFVHKRLWHQNIPAGLHDFADSLLLKMIVGLYVRKSYHGILDSDLSYF